MLNKLLLGAIYLLLFALLVFSCWLVLVYQSWPLWTLVPLVLGVLVTVWLLLWLRRRWIAWRLRRKLARDMPMVNSKANYTAFDQQWKAGVQVLREARLGGGSKSLYSLPWLLSINVGGTSSDAGYNEHAIRSVPSPDSSKALSGIDWFFLKASVVLGVRALPVSSQENIDTGAVQAWQRLLFWLLRTRRREPLNGVVFNLDLHWLNNASDADLVRTGTALRAQYDDLTRVFNARIPVWVVLTHAEHIAGFIPWAQSLEASLRSQPFGYSHTADPHGQSGSLAFLQMGFASVAARLAELRLALGQQSVLSPQVFELPERIAALQTKLERVFIPSFEATPYAATPLLRGLYWTASSHVGGVTEPYFITDLYQHVFPLQRYSWQSLDKLGSWRRVVRHVAVAGWAGVCVAMVFGLLYSSNDAKNVIQTIKVRNLHELNFDGELEADLQALNVWHDATMNLANANQGWPRLLPFRSHLANLEWYYKTEFASLYKTEIQRDFMDKIAVEDLPGVSRNGTDIDVAAWTQYLVRRINLVQAQLDGKSLENLPLPGSELAQLYGGSGRYMVGLQTGVLIGQLYPYYLAWQPERSLLQSELDGLLSAVRQLGLRSRNEQWLLAWAELQGNLHPITLTDFWNVPVDKSEPTIPDGLTQKGNAAIIDFVKEIAKATGEGKIWEVRNQELAQRFTQASYDTWYRFVAGFDRGSLYLQGESAWRSVVSSTFSKNDPHLKLLQELHDVFSAVPAQERPEWVAAAIDMQRVLQASELSLPANSNLWDRVREVGTLGHSGIQAITEGGSVEGGINAVREGLASVDEMKSYRENLGVAVKQLLLGPEQAMTLARQTWSYGQDENATESPLHQAQLHYQKMLPPGTEDARKSAVWRLMQGPLMLALNYTARSAACGLQTEWRASVLSTVQNVRSQVLAHELLYGDRGSIPAFMDGQVKGFVDRDLVGYKPRVALGRSIPLNQEFYSFISTVQLKQINNAENKLRTEEAGKTRAVQLEELQEQQADLEKQADALEALKAVVSIEAAAPLVNSGALVLPRRSSLSLQCAGSTITLENYNFPTKAVFEWSKNACADTTLDIQFPNFNLQKVYSGPDGFVRFLREFASGQRSFSRSDFPSQAADLTQAGVDTITLVWRIQGQEALLVNAERTDQLTTALAETKAAIKTLRQEQLGPSLDKQQVGDVADIIPENIVTACWDSPYDATSLASPSQPVPLVPGPPPTTADAKPSRTIVTAPQPEPVTTPMAVTKAPKQTTGPWYVQVGLFANPSKAQQQLDGLDIQHETSTIARNNGKSLYNVRATGFNDQHSAAQAAEKIGKMLGLKPLVLQAAQ